MARGSKRRKRRSSRRSPARRRSGGVSRGKKATPAMQLGGVALGFVLSEYAPALSEEPVGGIRIGAIIGAYLFFFRKGGSEFTKAVGLGLMLPDVKDLIGGVVGPMLEGISLGGVFGGDGESDKKTEAP